MLNQSTLEELLSECDKEKLHLCGHVQSFGGLLSVNKSDFIIHHVSENIKTFLHVKPKELLGQSLDKILPFLRDAIKAFLRLEPAVKFIYQTMTHQKRTIDIKLFDAGDFIVVEFENPSCEETHNNEYTHFAMDLLKPPKMAKDIENYSHNLLKGIFETIQYDRIMLYKFHEDWSGEVTAEITKEGIGSYLGLRFPASDIPSIARQLYLKNPFRHIADTHSINVPILSFEGTELDLTYSDTRSVSPVHIEYMKNMGMQGTFSTPIIVFGELWGLIACHNAASKYLCIANRNICKSLAKSFAIGISSYLTNEKLHKLDSIDRELHVLFEKIVRLDDVLDGIEMFEEEISRIIISDGFAIIIDDKLLCIGNVPQEESLGILDRWFTKNRQESSFVANSIKHASLRDIVPYEGIAGILAIKTIAQSGKLVRFYWFRDELKQEIAWAGNPDKPVIQSNGVQRLSPRNSFERWIEIKSGYAKEWNRLDEVIAMKVNKAIHKWF